MLLISRLGGRPAGKEGQGAIAQSLHCARYATPEHQPVPAAGLLACDGHHHWQQLMCTSTPPPSCCCEWLSCNTVNTMRIHQNTTPGQGPEPGPCQLHYCSGLRPPTCPRQLPRRAQSPLHRGQQPPHLLAAPLINVQLAAHRGHEVRRGCVGGGGGSSMRIVWVGWVGRGGDQGEPVQVRCMHSNQGGRGQ